MSLWENAFLSGATRMGLQKNGFIQVAASNAFAEKVVDEFRVKTTGVSHAANSLSGGNLQKFIVGREIMQNPGVIVALQPTWGVDAGSAAAIRQALIDLASRGAAVLAVSQDLEELFEISDRIAVICEGRMSEARPVENVTVEEIGLLMAGIGLEGEPADAA
jgi:simple sugar transport system ATP-binding protein